MVSKDEIFEIMSWLPAKSLHKFSTIARACKDFISETFFIEKQCRNSCLKPDEYVIIQDNSSLRSRAEEIYFSSFYEDGCDNDIPKKSLEFLKRECRILSSNNGLILCWNFDPNEASRLVLCNPVTRTWLPIELPNEAFATEKYMNNMIFTLVCGNIFTKKDKKFPFDCRILAFIKHIDPEVWNSGYDVYMLEQSKWLPKGENLPTGSNDLSLMDQVCCENGVFFISVLGICYQGDEGKYWPYVVHFDIENEGSNIIPLPDEARVGSKRSKCSFRLFGWESKNSWFKSLCLAKYSDMLVEIWILEDQTKHKISGNWKKFLNVNVINDLGFKDGDSWPNSFAIMSKKMIFADYDGIIYRYCLDGKDFGKLDKISEYNQRLGIQGLLFNAYSTTLRPCLKDPWHLPQKL